MATLLGGSALGSLGVTHALAASRFVREGALTFPGTKEGDLLAHGVEVEFGVAGSLV